MIIEFVYILSGIIGGLICGVIGHKLAEQKGKDPSTASIVCFLFGIFGVIYYACSEKEKANKSTNPDDVLDGFKKYYYKDLNDVKLSIMMDYPNFTEEIVNNIIAKFPKEVDEYKGFVNGDEIHPLYYSEYTYKIKKIYDNGIAFVTDAQNETLKLDLNDEKYVNYNNTPNVTANKEETNEEIVNRYVLLGIVLFVIVVIILGVSFFLSSH